MSPRKWRYLRLAFVVFACIAALQIYEQGGFDSMSIAGLGILILAFAAVGAALYFFIKDEPEDPSLD